MTIINFMKITFLILFILGFILFFMESYISYRTIIKGRTPHNRERTAKRWYRWLRWRKAFDVFISYKSEDAATARHLSEALLGSGHDVWFAEYTILLFNRDEFLKAIDLGTRQSRFGIAITSPLYTDSKHCTGELKQLLLPRNCGWNRILEIKKPGDERLYDEISEFKDTRKHEYHNSETALRAISQTTGLRIKDIFLNNDYKSMIQNDDVHITLRDMTFSINCGNWQETSETDPYLNEQKRELSRRFIANTEIGPVWATLNVNFISGPPREKRKPLEDQKAYYDKIRDMAKIEYGDTDPTSLEPHCYGVHLYELGGFTHPAFTCFKPPRTWFRRYRIILPENRTGKNIEFEFIFSIHGFFYKFVKVCRKMDEFVLSIRADNI
jgi:hypothetical protein